MQAGLSVLVFLLGSPLFAAQPPDLGHFKGTAFSSATVRQPLDIKGGRLVGCQSDPATTAGLITCTVEKGTLVVTGAEENALAVTLSRVAVLRSEAVAPTRHYYYRGTTELMIGDRPVLSEVKVTLTLEDKEPNKVRGFIDLPAQHARTSLEAYRF